MSLVYRANIKEVSNAITTRNPFREPNFFSEEDRTHGLFKTGKIESMMNNIFVFEKSDITDLTILSELSIFGFKIIETMNKILVSASISDLIHLFKNCPDKNKFIWSIYEDILAYYQPEYFNQLINLNIMDSYKFSPSYADKIVNKVEDITLENISLFHCDLYTYSLNHHFDEIKPETDNEDYVMSRDNDNYICNSFGEAYEKLNVSFYQLSKILNISYFIYRVPLNEITDFINKNNISKYTLFRSIEIMGQTKNDVVLVTTSLYDFMSTFKLYKEIYDSLSDNMKNIIDDMELLFNIIHNVMINTVSVKNHIERKEKTVFSDIKEKNTNSQKENESIDKYIEEIKSPVSLENNNGDNLQEDFVIKNDGGVNLFKDVKTPKTNSPEEKPIQKDGIIKRIIKAIRNK